MRRVLASVAVITLFLAACGGDDNSAPTSTAAEGGSSEAEVSATDSGDAAEQPASESDASAPAPSGPVELNTIRIGSQVWSRTLPMTTGQCFLFEDDGTLPTSATVWGTLDGDDGIRFSASYRQDGTFGAEVDDQTTNFWFAGPNGPGVDDLVIELDFETLTISGSGTFTNALDGESAPGAFEFQCEPEDG